MPPDTVAAAAEDACQLDISSGEHFPCQADFPVCRGKLDDAVCTGELADTSRDSSELLRGKGQL